MVITYEQEVVCTELNPYDTHAQLVEINKMYSGAKVVLVPMTCF